PLRHGARDYVPVLQTRKGELEALQEASPTVRAHTMPWIRLSGRGRNGKPQASTIDGWLRRLQPVMGIDLFFLDVLRLSPTLRVQTKSRKRPLLEVVHAAARRRGLRFVPAVRVDAPAAHMKIVERTAAHDQRGIALVYPLSELMLPPDKSAKTVLQEAL